jgi:hypothetical protein
MPPYSSPSKCSRCTARLQWQRTFSTNPSRLAISPESPAFIYIPEPKQAPRPPQRYIKGVLPVPKNLFPSGSEYKTTPEFIEKTAPRPIARAKPHGPEAERLEWKQRMADSRRRNLAEGIKELVTRQEKVTEVLEARGARRKAIHEREANKLERADEALTKPSLANSVRQVLDIHNNKVRGRTGNKIKYKKHQTRKMAERKDQLHTLYTHARKFITTEEALDDVLEKTFGTDDNPIRWNAMGLSVWALDAEPATVQDMLQPTKRENLTKGFGYQLKKDAKTTTVVQQRMKEIAETLTGGRIG